MEIIAAAAAGAAVNKAFSAATEKVEKKLSGLAKDMAIKAMASLKSYAPYLEETYERVSTFKTFADPANFVSVSDHFVSPTLGQENSEKRSITDSSLISKIISGKNIIVSARAGYGKSMLMKYICLSLFENPRGTIPLFMELRHINRHKNADILSLINKSYRRTSRVEVESLQQGLRSGAFCLVLDGFDEVHFDLRKSVEAQIADIAAEFPSCSIVVSGRPNEKFQSWKSFEVWHIDPMTKSKVIELLKKLNYRKDVVHRFVKKINGGLYDSHNSFMSTPLLAILMLLSYEQNANIPDKMHLFYSEAFKTLFHKHDATKDQYERARRSSLQIDEFQDVFSVFCLKTYVLEKTEFDYSEIRKHIKDSLQYFKKSETVEDLLFDLEEAVCLIMSEGSSYFFVHRSFQEFFTAAFLSSCSVEIRDDFLSNVSIRRWDGVLSMLFDMAKDQLEASWVADRCDEYLEAVGIGEDKKIIPLEARWSSISFGKSESSFEFFGFSAGRFLNFINTMHAFYPDAMHFDKGWMFEDLNEYAIANWDNFSNAETSKLNDEWTVKRVKIEEIPDDILKSTRFNEVAEYEYHAVEKIRSAISTEIMERNSFIDKLFSQGS